MNTFIEKKQETVEAVYFLSDLIGTKVLNGDKKIGKLQDIAIIEQGKLPIATHFVVHRPFGRKPLLVPWERVVAVNVARGIIVDLEVIEQFEGEPAETQIFVQRSHPGQKGP